MAYELFYQKPDLRGKGSRFGIRTGNSLKWNNQDHLASRRPCGLIRKEIMRYPQLPILQDGLQYGVEYSINRRRRWELAEALKTESEGLKEFNERIYEKPRKYIRAANKRGPLPLRIMQLMLETPPLRFYPKSAEHLFDNSPELRGEWHDVVAIVCNRAPHRLHLKRNAAHTAAALDEHRVTRACRCKLCRRRIRKHRKVFGHCTRSTNWFRSAEKLRRKGPSAALSRALNITQFYELLEPLPQASFPTHFPTRNARGKGLRAEKMKDLVKLAN